MDNRNPDPRRKLDGKRKLAEQKKKARIGKDRKTQEEMSGYLIRKCFELSVQGTTVAFCHTRCSGSIRRSTKTPHHRLCLLHASTTMQGNKQQNSKTAPPRSAALQHSQFKRNYGKKCSIHSVHHEVLPIIHTSHDVTHSTLCYPPPLWVILLLSQCEWGS